MCGRMKHLPGVLLNGQPVEDAVLNGSGNRTVAFHMKGDVEPHAGFLNGHARMETVSQKYPAADGWKVVTLPAAAIEERGQLFETAPNARIVAVAKRVETTSGPKVLVNIVTRPPLTKAEAAIHGRWPMMVRQKIDPETGQPLKKDNGKPVVERLPFLEDPS